MRSFTRRYSGKELAAFLLPIMLVELFSQLSGLMNTAVMSRVLEQQAIVTISACRVYPLIHSNLIGATATGFGVYVTRSIGASEPARLRLSAAQAIAGAWILTAVGMALICAVGPLIVWADIPPELREPARGYLVWLFAGSGALAFYNLFMGLLYGLGESVLAGGISVAGMALQPIFTFLYARTAGLGVRSAPASQMTGRLILAAVMLCYLLARHRELFGGRPRMADFWDGWKELWRCGFAKSAMLLSILFGTFMLQRQVNRMAPECITAYMYAFLAEDLFMVPVYACPQAVSAILAQNAGAGNFRLARQYYQKILHLSWAICAGLLAAVWLLAPACVRLLAGPVPEQVSVLVVRWLHVTSLAFPAVAAYAIGRAAMQAMGRYRLMWFWGILEGILRTVLAVVLISRSGFNTVIGTFFGLYTLNGIGIGTAAGRMMKKLAAGGNHGAEDHCVSP